MGGCLLCYTDVKCERNRRRRQNMKSEKTGSKEMFLASDLGLLWHVSAQQWGWEISGCFLTGTGSTGELLF